MHLPEGPTWDFFVLAAVIAIFPFIAERLRLPGILGLLFGGFLIGANGLSILDGEDVVKDTGAIGLLYLMFMAGLELDLGVFARYRRAAIGFGLLSFVLPFALGALAGAWIGLPFLGVILMGAVWASHTLVTYPIVRRFGITADPAVAVTVGATVITDTICLLVLAAVAGAQTGEASGPALFVQLALGMAALLALCFVVLTRLAAAFFSGVGHERTYRFIFVLACCIGAAVFADSVGIEGIVGAFFAGLALNRLIPDGSPLMDRISFFGSALFVPAFLVSVGLIIDPSVIAQPATIQAAAVFTLAIVLGKGSAALTAGRRLGLSGAQTGTMFSLSISQAAATLAATTVGAAIGLFDQTIVNAVIVVIIISLTISSLATTWFAARVPRPQGEIGHLGAAVVIAVEDADAAARLSRLARRIARSDGGLVIPVHVVVESEGADGLATGRRVATEIDDRLERDGLEAGTSLRVAVSLRQGIRNAVAESNGSLLVLEREASSRPQDLILGGRYEELVEASSIPVLVVALADEPIRRVVVPLQAGDLDPVRATDTRLVMVLATRLEAGGLKMVAGLPEGTTTVADVVLPRTARIVPMSDGSRLAWARDRARAGDLILVPAGIGSWVFGLEASRIAAMPGISVAVMTGPYRAVEGTGTADVAPNVVGSDRSA